MRTGCLAFLSGTLLIQLLPELPPVVVLSMLGLFTVIFYLKYPSFRLIGFFCTGFIWASATAYLILSNQLSQDIESQEVIVIGKIASLPEINSLRNRFEFEITKIADKEGKTWPTPGKVRLSWYQNYQPVTPGETWKLHIKLKRPHGFSNPGGFDYERWLFQKRLRATGYVVGNKNNKRVNPPDGYFLERARFKIRNQILKLTKKNSQKGLITALALGDRSQLSSSQKHILINTGTSHLLAISGLHISLVAGLVYFLMLGLWRQSEYLLLINPAQNSATIAGLSGAVIYALLAGMSLPTQRALIMLSVVMLSLIFKKRIAFSVVFSFALLLVLFFDPLSTMDAGFWLSFIAVVLIAYSIFCRSGITGNLWKWGKIQLALAIGLAPLLLLWFQKIPLTAIFANLVAVPLVSIVIVPVILIGVLMLPISHFIAGLLMELANICLKWLMQYLYWLSSLDITIWQHASPSIPLLLFAMMGVFLLLQPRGMPARWLGLIWILPVFLTVKPRPVNGEFNMILLDVGQGLSAVVETHEHVLVFDTGATFSREFNAGEAVIIPYLLHKGFEKIDNLIISHGDNDHIGGVGAILQKYPDTSVITSVPERFAKRQVQICKTGDSWEWDNILFQILSPEYGFNGSNNNRSCVLKISNDKFSLLLTGDIEKEAELHLLKTRPKNLQVDVLIAPHHGSKTSSTAEFVNVVKPKWVLYPVGYQNRFKLPNQDIIARYRKLGSKQLDTARNGAIIINFTRQGIYVTPFRQYNRRFWRTD